MINLVNLANCLRQSVKCYLLYFNVSLVYYQVHFWPTLIPYAERIFVG